MAKKTNIKQLTRELKTFSDVTIIDYLPIKFEDDLKYLQDTITTIKKETKEPYGKFMSEYILNILNDIENEIYKSDIAYISIDNLNSSLINLYNCFDEYNKEIINQVHNLEPQLFEDDFNKLIDFVDKINELSKEYDLYELANDFNSMHKTTDIQLSDLRMENLKTLLNQNNLKDCMLFNNDNDFNEYLKNIVNKGYLNHVTDFIKIYFNYDDFIEDRKSDYHIITLKNCILVTEKQL